MAMIGSFETMALSELFQWASVHGKSGVLKVTRGKSVSRFCFDHGVLRGVASNDPPSKLGQFLISRGKIDEDQLNEALSRQEREPGRTLGSILVDMGLTRNDELDRYCVAKAEETIFGLMETDDAMFEFDHEGRLANEMVAMHTDVDDLLMRAATRRDELERMRLVLSGPGAVLMRTEHEMHPETSSSSIARRLYDAIDGKRTFAEILLRTRASEFAATRFVYEMLRRDIVRIVDVREAQPAPGSPGAACDLARRLRERNEYEMAIDVLNSTLRAHPDSVELRSTLDATEAAFLESAYASQVRPDAVPVPAGEGASASGPGLGSNELYLLELIEPAKWDVRSLVRVSPLHEIDVIRSVKSLLEKGFVEMRLPAGADRSAPVGSPQDLFRDIDAVAAIDGSLERTFPGS